MTLMEGMVRIIDSRVMKLRTRRASGEGTTAVGRPGLRFGKVGGGAQGWERSPMY